MSLTQPMPLQDDLRTQLRTHAIMRALETVEKDTAETGGLQQNGYPEGEVLKERLESILGEVIGTKVYEVGRQSLTKALLETAADI